MSTAAAATLLFEPLTLRHVRLPNRVVVPPMLQIRPICSPQGIAWYRRLASGGAGTVIVEGTSVQGFGDTLTAPVLAPLAQAIRSAGAVPVIQLTLGYPKTVSVQDLSLEQVRTSIRQFALAAALCAEAGFAGVEPHGAHGFLHNQFFMPPRNPRQDAYGGSPENRARLGRDIVRAIRAAVGDSLLIFYRHSPTGEGYTLEDSLRLAGWLREDGLDVLDVSPARRERPADLAQPFKHAYGPAGPAVIAVGGMDDPAAAAEALSRGACDLVAVGRQLIADAAYPRKVQQDRLAEVLRCTQCNEGCYGHIRQGQPVACVQWKTDEVAAFLA